MKDTKSMCTFWTSPHSCSASSLLFLANTTWHTNDFLGIDGTHWTRGAQYHYTKCVDVIDCAESEYLQSQNVWMPSIAQSVNYTNHTMCGCQWTYRGVWWSTPCWQISKCWQIPRRPLHKKKRCEVGQKRVGYFKTGCFCAKMCAMQVTLVWSMVHATALAVDM